MANKFLIQGRAQRYKIPFLDAASLNAKEPFLDELILETMDMGGKPPSSKWSAL